MIWEGNRDFNNRTMIQNYDQSTFWQKPTKRDTITYNQKKKKKKNWKFLTSSDTKNKIEGGFCYS